MAKPCRSKICNPSGGAPAGTQEAWLNQAASPEVKEALKEMHLKNEDLKKEMGIFLDNIQRGLGKDTHSSAIVKCFSTYVQDLPDRTCKGRYLALDIGGTNFRILLVTIDNGKLSTQAKTYVIPSEIMIGSGVPLFDYIAESLADFIISNGLQAEVLPLGFTFSFPLEQTGLKKGILERWTKGFKCDDVIGQDVVQWLHEAIERRGDIKIDLVAVINDTTGTLMACAWDNPDARIGLIVGTGNNGCYYETQANAELFDEPDMGSGKVIINLEMGAFGDDGSIDFLRTDIDRAVDDASLNKGKQQHEKMISGMYLGEVVRRYALKFTEAGFMFGGNVSEELKTVEKFATEHLTEIESDPVGNLTKAKKIAQILGQPNATEQDLINLRYISQCASRRAAHLSASAMCTLIHKMGEPKVIVGVDGSVYKYHPHFRRVMIEKMHELIEPKYTFDVVLAEDGSGIGAALVAAVADRKKKEVEGPEDEPLPV